MHNKLFLMDPDSFSSNLRMFSLLELCRWLNPSTVTRFSRTSALLSAASRGKVELIIEHYRAARCCRDQTQHPFTSFKLKKKKKSWGWEPLDPVLLLRQHMSWLRGPGITGWEEAAACSADPRSVHTHASPWLFKGDPCKSGSAAQMPGLRRSGDLTDEANDPEHYVTSDRRHEDNEDVTQRDVLNYDVKHLSPNVPVCNVV